jgi:cell division protein FtsW (lipid II flippase)
MDKARNKRLHGNLFVKSWIYRYPFISLLVSILLKCKIKGQKNDKNKWIKIGIIAVIQIRDFSELSYWKANEFKVFMLNIGIPT